MNHFCKKEIHSQWGEVEFVKIDMESQNQSTMSTHSSKYPVSQNYLEILSQSIVSK